MPLRRKEAVELRPARQRSTPFTCCSLQRKRSSRAQADAIDVDTQLAQADLLSEEAMLALMCLLGDSADQITNAHGKPEET
jgi:hypothetical protein